jgi:molybdenum cofactor cytidylyltransferase
VTGAAPRASELAGVVLAAGSSRRMGLSKLTLPWTEGRAIIEAVVAALRGGGVRRILVVVGGDRQDVEAAVARSQVELVENSGSAGGEMLSSIQAGLRALGDLPAAALITPGDLPAMRPTTVRAVARAWETAHDTICVPVHGGRRGHPVLLPRRVWPEVLALPSGQSLRDYLRPLAREIVAVEVDDAGIHADVDTPQDYHATR